MKIIFFTHPDFLGHQSMPRFTKMLVEGMQKRGHETEVWTPHPKFLNFSSQKFLKKWLGYIDQFIVFPKQVKKKIVEQDKNALYVFIDQALGPWVPLVKTKAHIVHCHDFLAQLSAIGKIKQNPLSTTGKVYQMYIRKGYSEAKNFISVSEKTKADLLNFLNFKPTICKVVYNGLNQSYIPFDNNKARELLNKATGISLEKGFILHVGGNHWYKNRVGVVDIYSAWRKNSNANCPLLLIGEKASVELEQKILNSVYCEDIYVLNNMSDENVRMAYCGASVLIFPSIAEGFGWPIAEAMASGCPVITTDEAPMTEVAGNAGLLIPVMPDTTDKIIVWAADAAKKVEYILNLSVIEREVIVNAGIINAKRFDTEKALDKIESIYLDVLSAKSLELTA